ncbi:MAG: efflux RND transporter periplasmic adaptor subunit [Spirochaetaceae bacterium]
MRKALAAVALAGVVMLVGCGGPPGARGGGNGEAGAERPDAGEEERTPLAVEAVEARVQPLVREIRGSGIVRGAREAVLVSETEGVLESVSLRLGDFVEEDTPIATLDDTVERLNYEQAQQELERASIELNAIERRAETGNASDAELSRVRSTVSGARSRAEQNRLSLENRTLRAPISGYVASRMDGLTPGNYLSRGVEVARFVDLSALELEIFLGEREVRFLEVGSPAIVTVPSCEPRERNAEVTAIAAGSDPGTGSFSVLLSWENECEQIRSGVSATVSVEPTNQREQLVIPGSAIVEEDGTHVFVAREDVAVRQEVEVEERLGDRAAIAAGLEEGDVVLVSGVTVIADGDPISVTLRERN